MISVIENSFKFNYPRDSYSDWKINVVGKMRLALSPHHSQTPAELTREVASLSNNFQVTDLVQLFNLLKWLTDNGWLICSQTLVIYLNCFVF